MLGDLTTIANVKAWMVIDPTVTFDDSVISRLITSASTFIQSWLDRTIAVTAYNEYRNGSGGYSIVTRMWPIQTITALSVNGAAVPAAPPMQSGNPFSLGYAFDKETIYLRGFQFLVGKQNINIQYTAGFTLVPYDIEQACIELVTWAYRDRGREGQSSKNIGQGQVVAFRITDFAPRTLTALRQYKNEQPLWS